MSDTTTETKMSLRDQIRKNVFDAKPEVRAVEDFFGSTVELRQPELGVVLNMRKDDETSQVARMLIDYTYVPGTDEKVFEEADVDAIQKIPFGPQMKNYIDQMNTLLGVDPVKTEDAIKDATKSA